MSRYSQFWLYMFLNSFHVVIPFLSLQCRAAGQEMDAGIVQPTPQLLLTLIVLSSKHDQHTQHPLQGLI